MSINLGSAEGHIIIRSDKATKGARETIRAIRSMESQAEGSGRGFDKMARSGEQMGRAVSRGAQEAQRGIQVLARSTQDADQAFDRLGSNAGVLGGVIAASLGAAAKSAADLQSQIALISTIRPDINIAQVGDQIQAMSTRVAQSTEQLSESLYNVFSSVEVSQEEALRLTEEFAKGAVAARTDAETFGTAILGVMNAYKLEVEDAGHVSDVFFNTINKGVISGDQLASVLGNVSQAAKNANVNFDTLGALIAGVTKEGGEASVNVNNLNNALQKIVTEDVQQGLAALGIQTKDANGNFRDIVAVLRDLDAVLGRLSQSQRADVLQKLFPDAQARTGIQTLLSQLAFVEEVARDNAQAANVASDAYQKMGATASAQAQILKNTLIATLQDMGELALPGLVAAAERIREVVAAFNELPPGVKSAVVTTGELLAVFLVLGAAGIKVVTTAIEVATAVRTAATAMAAGTKAAYAYASSLTAVQAASVIGPALVAIGLAAAGTAITMHSLEEGTRKAADAIGGDLGDAIRSVDVSKLDALKSFLTGIDVAAEEAEDATARWASLQETAIVRAEYLAAANKLAQLSIEGRGGSSEAAKIRAVVDALREEVVVREQLNQEQAIRDRYLTSEAEAGLPQLGEGAARATAAITILNPTLQNALAIVQRLGGAVGSTAGSVDELSASFFANQQSAAALAAQQDVIANNAALVTFLESLQQRAQGVTTSVQPLQAALDLLNARVAAGIPLTSEQAHLLSTLPGYIASATSSYDQLVTAQAQAAIAIQNAQAPATAAGGAFSGMAGEAGRLQSALDNLRASAIQLEGAIGALGTENGKLGAQYSILNERVQALNEQKKNGAGLTAAEAQELATLEAALGQLGGQMGINAAQQRDLILQLLGVQSATKTTTGALNDVHAAWANVAPPADVTTGIEGLTSGLGEIAPAAAPAITAVDLVAQAVQNLPAQKTVTVDVQVTGVGGVGDAAAGLKGLTEFGPGDLGATAGAQTITVDVQDNASAILETIRGKLEALEGDGTTPTIGVTDNATTVIEAVRAKLDDYGKQAPNPTISATDNASGVAATATQNINAVPDGHDTLLTVTDQATQKVIDLIGLINSVPTTLSVTASVDTSGAMAAIADLRANMPSSPAEKGPFRTLPDWNSVFASLEPAGEGAVAAIERTTLEMARAIGDGIDAATDESAGKAADLASKVAGAVNATADALQRIRAVRPPEPGQFERFRAATLPILDAFAEDGASRGEDAASAASRWAESAQKVFGAVSSGADALAKLRDYVRPADRAILDFRDASQFLTNLMVQVAQDSDQEITEAGAIWAEAAATIFQAVGSGVDALTKLTGFKRPTDKAATDFRDISQFVVNLIAQVAADIEDHALPKAHDWAETASAIFSALSGGVDALTKLHGFERPTDRAVESFRDVAQYTVNLLAQVAADIEDQALPKAQTWGETAIAIFGALSSGVDALTKLHDFERPTDAALEAFRDVTQYAVNLIAQAATLTDAEMTVAAATYAEAATTVLDLIGSGYATLDKIGSDADGFTPPDRATLDRVAESARQAVLAVAQAARLVETELVEESADFADGATKAVGLIGAGLANFADIPTFIPPSEAQIRALVNVAAETVRRVAEAASTMDSELVEAAGEFGEKGSSAVGLLGTTISAFGNMKDWVVPSKEGIDGVVGVAAYAAQRLGDVAMGFDPNLLARIDQFGSGVGSGLDAIRSAMELGKAFQDEDRVKPADAIGTALQEFQDGLGPLAALKALSEQYLAQGIQAGANFAQTWQALRAGYPGMDAAQAAQVGMTIAPGTQVVRHEYSGAIRFEMMDENGGWIARSLRADQASRRDVASQVVEEVLAANPAA